MSDIVLRTQVATQIKADELVERVSNHLSREEGQAGIEYVGILLFVGAALALIIALAPDFADRIKGGFDQAFSKIGI